MVEDRRSAPPRRNNKGGFAGMGNITNMMLSPEASRAMQSIGEVLTKRFGQGPIVERAVTWGDLAKSGLAKLYLPNGNALGKTPGETEITAEPLPVPSPPVYEIPPPPTGFEGTGASNTVILQWDAPAYAGHAHTEVYKNAVNNLATAVLAGRTQNRVYADRVGATGITSYYWIRHVNEIGQAGPYHDSDGLDVETGSASGGESDAAFDLLVVDRGIIVEALIGDAEIGGAKIRDASIESAKIVSISAGQIAAGAIGVNEYIQSLNYSAGVSGWRINGDGSCEFQNAIVRGDVTADNVSANTSLNAPTITGGTISGGAISGGSITGVSITGSTVQGTNVIGGTFTGNLLRSTDTTRWLDFDVSADYILFTPKAKIKGDGSTVFSNEIGSGTFSPGSGTYRQQEADGVADSPAVGYWSSQWFRFFIDTGININEDLENRGVFGARLDVQSTQVNGTAPPPGDRLLDVRYNAQIVLSQAFYRTGASPDYGTDIISGRNGESRILIQVDMQYWGVPIAHSWAELLELDWELYQVT